MSTPNSALRIALIGDQYYHNEPAHPVIEEFLSAIGVDIHWMDTGILDGPEVLGSFHGVWVVPGAPKNRLGVHVAINYARTAGVPLLGTCDGFFGALLEHAENELGLPEAIGLAENDAKIGPLMFPLVCSLGDRRTPLKLRPNSLLAEVYGRAIGIREVLHCDYGLRPEFMAAAQQGQLRYGAWDPDGAPRELEIIGHPFFMAVLFKPELSCTKESAHPIVMRFLDSARAFAARSAPVWQSYGSRR